MKWLLAVLALISVSFAAGDAPDWIPIALLSVFVAVSVLVIFYLLSYLIDSAEMRGMVTGELYQVVMTGVIIAIFIGVESFSTITFASMLGKELGADDTHINYSIQVTQQMVDYQWKQLKKFADEMVSPMAVLSAYSGQCAFLGFRFGYNGCASIAVPTTSGVIAARVMAASFMVLNSQLALLYIARDFFFPIVLPLGLFLRTFHVTRGAGGFLIAIAASFYFIYPISVIVTNGVYANSPLGKVEASFPEPPETITPPTAGIEDVTGNCNPYDLKFGATFDVIEKLNKKDLVDPLLSLFFIGGLLSTAINLLAALSGVRALTRIFGIEVDVSALARIS